MSAGEAKAALRAALRDMFRWQPPAALRRLDAALLSRLMEFAPAAEGKTLLAFHPLADEPDLSVFFRMWADRGGRVALPVWLGREKMTLRHCLDWDAIQPGRGGIREPGPEAPTVSAGELDVVVTPGRAFSEACMRLGRGGGCYDSLFAARPGCLKIGVAYDFQILADLPADRHDQPVDVVVTPGRVVDRRCSDGSK